MILQQRQTPPLSGVKTFLSKSTRISAQRTPATRPVRWRLVWPKSTYQAGVLHLTTAKEMELFEVGPLENKRITAEACVHHLLFMQTITQNAARSSNAIRRSRPLPTGSAAEGRRRSYRRHRHRLQTIRWKKSRKYAGAPAGCRWFSMLWYH